MADPSIFAKTLELLKENVEEDDDYKEDFDESVDEESKDNLTQPEPSIKPNNTTTKSFFDPKAANQFKTLNTQESINNNNNTNNPTGKTVKFATKQDQPTPNLTIDETVSERIDLEESFIELRNILKKKRLKFLKFCEEKELHRRKIQDKIKNYVEGIELDKKDKAEEKKPLFGILLIDDFIKVLQAFEFKRLNKDFVIKLLTTIRCYWRVKDVMNYRKLMRQSYSVKNFMSRTTLEFDPIKKPRIFKDESSAREFIGSRLEIFRKNILKKKEEEKKKLQEEIGENVQIDEILQNPSKMLDFMIERITTCEASLPEIFKAFDTNGDGRIDFQEFCDGMLDTGIKFPVDVLKAVFSRFDDNENGSISYVEFLATLYGDESKRKDFVNYMLIAEKNFEKLKLLIREKYSTFDEMFQEMKKPRRLTSADFKIFCLGITDHFSRIQLNDIFNLLDENKNGFIYLPQIKKLYDNQNLIEISETPKILTTEEEEKLKEEERLKKERDELKMQLAENLMSERQKIEARRLPGLMDLEAKKQWSKVDENLVKKAELLEHFMIDFSNNVLEQLKKEGKNLRDLFTIFAKESAGYLNPYEFNTACQMIMNDNDIPLTLTNNFFNIFVVGYPKKMSFQVFSHIVFIGKKGNSIYIKCKQKFKEHLENNKRIFFEEFQRLDARTGSGEIPLVTVQELFKYNDILFDEKDMKFLKEENILVQKGNVNYVKYVRFMNLVFPDANPIESTILIGAIRRIQRAFKKYIMRKKLYEQEDKKPERGKKVGANKRGTSNDRSKTKLGLSKTDKKAGKDMKEAPASTKPKELYEFETKPQKVIEIQEDKKPAIPSQKKRKPGEKKVATLEEKMKQKLGEPQKDDKAKEKYQRIYETCKKLILDIITNATNYGSSIQLSKEIQQKYESRIVSKDVFITLQDLEIEIVDLLPRSFAFSSQTGRLIYLDNNGNLYQYDIANKQKLKPLSLSSKVPLKKCKIIDMVFDNKAGRIYTLTDSWMLEIWEIHQDLSVPIYRLKVLSIDIEKNAISHSYVKRYNDLFPQFITLSILSHQLLIVNCSCINNSLVFIDPVSLSVLSQVYLDHEDFKMPASLTKSLAELKPVFEDMQKRSLPIEKVFENYFSKENSDLILSKPDFIKIIQESFGVTLDQKQLSDLYDFLDQDSDQILKLDELYFLQELSMKLERKQFISTIVIPKSLQGLQPSVLATLQKLQNFVKRFRLKIRDAFNIFDNNKSGSISAAEFAEIIDQFLPDVSDDDKENLMLAADRDGNGLIDFQEFSQLFYDVESLTLEEDKNANINQRSQLLQLFESIFEAGVDLEEYFAKNDPLHQGSIKLIDFKNIFKNLPLGITDNDLDIILNTDIDYTDSGKIDYIKIVNHPAFRKAKFIAKLKNPLLEEKERNKMLDQVEATDGGFEPQKIMIESIIYVDDLDLMIYTTVLPRTSSIFVSSAKKVLKSNSNAEVKQIFTNKLLAKLDGHRSMNPPTICYIPESGCLVSGDKIEKRFEFSQTNNGIPMLAPATSKESFATFYKNVEINKQFSTDILIWNLKKDIFDVCNSNPPWKVLPTKIIKNAHNDSIVDITYLSHSQLIATASLDKTIKIWDPTARPFSLKHPKDSNIAKIKPGTYEPIEDQYTNSNTPFGEIKRIYTGDLTCYKISNFITRIPIANFGKDTNSIGKNVVFEMVFTLNLAKAQLIGKTMKYPGAIRGYNIDRLQIEIPANRVDDVIPRKYYKELEDLCIERRKKSLSFLQVHLSSSLEYLKVKVMMQNSSLKKIQHLLRKISLIKFDDEYDHKLLNDLSKELFQTFLQLPFRVSFDSFLAVTGLKNQLSISELYYYLKKYKQIHPLNITKEEFFYEVQEINVRANRLLLTDGNKMSDIAKSISNAIKLGQVNFKIDLYMTNDKKLDAVSRDQFKNYLLSKKLVTNDKEVEELMNTLDPFITNMIKLTILEEMFHNEILEYKLTLYNRPNVIIKNFVSNLNSKQKIILVFSLNECNANKDGYLNQQEFIQAFINAGIPFNKLDIIEVFERLAEKYSHNDKEKVLSLSYFCKKLFTQFENFEMLRIMNIFGKIKSSLIFKKISIQSLFTEVKTEVSNNKPGSSSISSSSSLAMPSLTSSSTTLPIITKQDFINKLIQANIQDLHKNEIEKLASFLSVMDAKTKTPYISLNMIQYYLRKLEIKFQFNSLQDYKNLYNTVKEILSKEDSIRKYYESFQRKKFNMAGIRYILGEINVYQENIDMILLKFVEEDEMSFEAFITKLKNFMDSYDNLGEKPLYMNDTMITTTTLGDISGSVTTGQDQIEKKNVDNLFKKKSNVGELLKQKSARLGLTNEIQQKKLQIGRKKHIETVVNLIRSHGREKIQDLLDSCIRFDTQKNGKLKLAVFINIVKFSYNDFTEEHLINFQNQYSRLKKDNSIDYQEFFDDYLLKNLQEEPTERKLPIFNMNTLMIEFAKGIKNSGVNIYKAFEFYDEKLNKTISIDNFKRILKISKVIFSEEEINFIMENTKADKYNLDYDKLLNYYDYASHDCASIYDFSTWMIAADLLDKILLRKVADSTEEIRFVVKQSLKENTNTNIHYPILVGKQLYNSLIKLKQDYTQKDAEDLTNYAIIGSRITVQDALKKKNQVDIFDFNTELLHFELFLTSLSDIRDRKLQLDQKDRSMSKSDINTKALLHDSKSHDMMNEDRTLEQKYVIARIRAILQEREITLWDSIVFTNMTVTEQTKITLPEFKFLLNSLNLGLTLKDKMHIYELVDPFKTGKVDLPRFIEIIEDKGMTERALRTILEKFAVALFFNDLSLKAAFDIFDNLDRDEKITPNEFFSGMSNLDLGMSIFEIRQLMNLIDINHDGYIDKAEFCTQFERFFKKYEIDPSRDLSFSLYAKINHLRTVKGMDLMEAFKSVDIHRKGEVDLDGFRKALNNFGMENIKPYQFTALIKLSQQPIANTSGLQSKPSVRILDGKRVLIKEKTDFTTDILINYPQFVEKLYSEVKRNLQMVVEATHDLLRKIYTMMQRRNLSLYECFVLFDVNASNALSKLEFKIGLQNLGINWPDSDISMIWNSFEKTSKFKVHYLGFFKAFLESGAFTIIKFDESLDLLIKKFHHVITRLGNYEEAFAKIDKNSSGFVTLGEFREQCNRLHFGLQPHEIDLIFNALSKIEHVRYGPEKVQIESNIKGFSYRQFVKLFLRFRNLGQSDHLFAKLYKLSKDRRIIWKQQFASHKTEVKMKNPGELVLKDVKNLLKSLKLGLTNEDLDIIVNSFESSVINSLILEQRLEAGAKKIDDASKERNLLIHSLVNEINKSIAIEKIPLERLFFDFDTRQAGSLELHELTSLIYFLKIHSSKNQIKVFFDAVDYDKKGYITLNEFKGFIEESAIQQNSNKAEYKPNPKDSMLEDIILRMKEALVNSQKTLQKTIYDLGYRIGEVMTKFQLEKILQAIGVILKKDEIEFFYDKIVENCWNQICNFEEFLNFAIREQIEVISFDENFHHVHPAVAVYVEKINKIFEKLQVNPKTGFKYFILPNRTSISKKHFVRVIQSLNLSLGQDDIILLYNYFDEKNFGEITLDNFVEKFEVLAHFSLQKLNNPIMPNKDEEKEAEDIISTKKISMKQHIVGILQKIYFFFLEKKYNKRQIIAVFDKNGNGLLNREDFLEGIKNLNLGVSIEKARILMDYLDSNENGLLEVEEFINQLYDSVPQNSKGSFRYNQGLGILKKIVDKLSDQSYQFLVEMVKFEKAVKNDDERIDRKKTGIYVLDFFKLLKDYSISLEEDDKNLIKDVFSLKSTANYIDIESIFNHIENLLHKGDQHDHSKTLNTTNKSQNEALLSDNAEQQIYRKIGDNLRTMNLTIEQAFKFIDQDKNETISEIEFKKLLRSLQVEFTERELQLLIAKVQLVKGMIPKQTFINKFWNAYAPYAQKVEDDPERIKDLKGRARQIACSTLNQLKINKQYTAESVWVLFDNRKNGAFTLEDLRTGLSKAEIYLSKQDLGNLFNFVDKNQDGYISYNEFQDYWNQNTTLFDDGPKIDNEIKELEEEILEHLAKIVNQSGISLWDIYSQFDKDNRGFITDREFDKLLRKIGVALPDMKVEQLMRLIDANADKKISFSEIEAKLVKYGLKLEINDEVEKISWNDRAIKALTIGSNIIAKQMLFEDYLKRFDNDYDGYLTTTDFINAIKGLNVSFKDEQIHRLAHMFQSNSLDNRISVKKILDAVNTAIDSHDIRATQYEIVSIGEEIFEYIITNYEGITKMFSSIQEVKKNIGDISNFVHKSRRKFRSFHLVGMQYSMVKLGQKIDFLLKLLDKGINLVLKQANQLIINEAYLKLLNPADNKEIYDRDKLKETDQEISLVQLNQLGDNSSFNIEFDTLDFISPFIKKYKGFYFKTDQPIEILVYEKETLLYVSTDGHQFQHHLDFELKLYHILSMNHDYLFKHHAKFEKRVGIDSLERDIYLINEHIDEKKWISLEDLIKQNGGLLRIPFLCRTQAIVFIIKYWASQIINIIHNVHDKGCVLLLLRPNNIYVSKDGQKIKLKSLRGVGKINEMGKVIKAPEFHMNTFDKSLKYDTEASKFIKDPNIEENNMLLDAYLAPEMGMLELTQAVDVWALGCLLYHVLFGEPPVSFYQKVVEDSPNVKKDLKTFTYPSDYFFHDLYPDTLINDILKIDYELDISPESKHMINCIKNKTYETLFDAILAKNNILEKDNNMSIGPPNSKSKELLNSIGCYLDLIAACLEYDPTKRPTINALKNCPVFQLDKYEDMISKQYAQIMIFFRSPSLNIRDRVILPLRKICSEVITKPKSIFNYENDILNIMEIINLTVIEKRLKVLEDLTRTTTKSLTSSKIQYPNMTSTMSKSLNKTNGITLKDTKIAEKIKAIEEERNKSPNQVLVKFIFENQVLDLLVFLTLRHHWESKLLTKKKKKKTADNKELTYDDIVRLVKGMSEVFKSIIYDFTNYSNSCSPYVQNVIENLIKLYIGEEFKLASDITDLLSTDTQTPYKASTNLYSDYTTIQRPKPLMTFFRKETDSNEDEADLAWRNAFLTRPYILTETKWTPEINHIIGPIYKETITESGVGSCNYPVVQDYIRFETENYRQFDFDIENRLKYINNKIGNYYRRTAEYFNDIIHIAENIQILYEFEPEKGKSNLRISLSYIKALIQSNNTDKLKLLLDSKIIIHACKYLGFDDVHIKAEILEILYELSKAFERTSMNMVNKTKNESLKGHEENIKTIGLVSHFNKTNLKDKETKDRIITYSYDYSSFNKMINNKYLRQMAFIFESPVIMTLMITVIKTQAELLKNKTFVIKIFENLTNAPVSIIKSLNFASIDTMASLCKMLITNKRGLELKQNTVLAPILTETLKKILNDARPEILDMMTNIVGIRALLREQNLEVPPKLNLTLIHEKLEKLDEFFNKNQERIINEIQGSIIAARLDSTNRNVDMLMGLNDMIQYNNIITLSWLRHYYTSRENDIAYNDVRNCFNKLTDIYMSVFDSLQEYSQIVDICTNIIHQIGYFINTMIESEFYYILINSKEVERACKILLWMFDKITYINSYHLSMDQDERRLELEEREKDLTMTMTANFQQKRSLALENTLNRESLKRYSTNRLIIISHVFQRTFLKLLTVNHPEYNQILERVELPQFFAKLIKDSYFIISSSIKTHTEDIHLLLNYAEESRLRLKTFEKLMSNDANELREQFVTTGIIHDICEHYLPNYDELDVSMNKLSSEFLPFRNFLPLRNESIAFISIITHLKNIDDFVFKDLLMALTRYDNLRMEYENLKKYKKGLIYTSSLYFFSVIINMQHQQFNFIMKQEGILEYLKNIVKSQQEVAINYPFLAEFFADY